MFPDSLPPVLVVFCLPLLSVSISSVFWLAPCLGRLTLSGLLHLGSFCWLAPHWVRSRTEWLEGMRRERTGYFPCFHKALWLGLHPSISVVPAGGLSCVDLGLSAIWQHCSLPLPFQPYRVNECPLLLVCRCLSIPHLSLNSTCASSSSPFIDITFVGNSVSSSDPELMHCLVAHC